MKTYKIKIIQGKGKGVFAARNIKKNELIFCLNISNLKKYDLNEIASNPGLDGDHSDYVGNGKYVIDHSPCSYMNHSCDPNTIVKHLSLTKKKIYALKDIQKGDELTHDYAAGAVDQINNKNGWLMKCRCHSKDCRKIINGDFFKLPINLQKKYYPFLAQSTKRRFRKRFERIIHKR